MIFTEKVKTFEHFRRFKIGRSRFWKEGKCQASGWLWRVGVSGALAAAVAATGLHHFPSLDLKEHPPILELFLSFFLPFLLKMAHCGWVKMLNHFSIYFPRVFF